MKIIIWIQVDSDAWLGRNGAYLENALKILAAQCGGVTVIGVIDSERKFFRGNVNIIDERNLNKYSCDLIVVSGNPKTLAPVWSVTKNFGIAAEKIILDRTICTAGFTLQNYRRLCRAHLSILSRNCWGGLMFSILGLRYNSPTVNMLADTDEQFLELLKDPLENLCAEPEFVRMDRKYQKDGKFYPVFKIGGVEWHMNHYIYDGHGKEYALNKWRERLRRVNWFNLLVAMSTERPEIAAEFDRLPYAKKICLTNFPSDLDSAFYLPLPSGKFNDVAALADYTTRAYNVWDMLLYGKKTPLT